MSDVANLILQGIRDFSANRPRSLQTEIGPSQLGNPCDHCLTAALVGWEKVGDEAWLPLIGTAVHELLLGDASEWSGDEWMREARITVGWLEGTKARIEGNADLYHIPTGTVVDLKVVGSNTLNGVRKGGPSQQYRVQTQLYARGFQLTYGFMPETVIIAYLPRNSMRLSDAYFDIRPYDVSIAVEALERADELLGRARAIGAVSEVAMNVYIDGLPRAAGCYDCARYPTIVPRVSELAEFATNHTNGSTI